MAEPSSKTVLICGPRSVLFFGNDLSTADLHKNTVYSMMSNPANITTTIVIINPVAYFSGSSVASVTNPNSPNNLVLFIFAAFHFSTSFTVHFSQLLIYNRVFPMNQTRSRVQAISLYSGRYQTKNRFCLPMSINHHLPLICPNTAQQYGAT